MHLFNERNVLMLIFVKYLLSKQNLWNYCLFIYTFGVNDGKKRY
jgi:hypothetical protein